MKRTNYYEICKQKLKYLNYSERTIEMYLHYIDKFLKSNETVEPSRLTASDFQLPDIKTSRPLNAIPMCQINYFQK